jgi:cation:H+ antiporter
LEYFGAEYTIASLEQMALLLNIPSSLVALTLLSIGTTLPELAVNISAIRQGNAEMAIGNVLGSCVFNSLVVPPAAAILGTINVPANLLGFSLPVMAAAGLLFYLLTQDKKMSVWEGLLFVTLYALFILKVSIGA